MLETQPFCKPNPPGLFKIDPAAQIVKTRKAKSPLIWYYNQTFTAKCINHIPFTHLASCLFVHQDFRMRQEREWLTNTKSWDYYCLYPTRNQPQQMSAHQTLQIAHFSQHFSFFLTVLHSKG